ncbi:MAG: HAD family hydrolase [Longibaculum sp.]
MYKQSINNIKVVIIPLDGTILDLNRLRYNYYHHLCEHRKIPFDMKTFYPHLSNMYDMYNGLPLSKNVDTGPLNAKIERELKEYLRLKGVNVKDGFLELLEYLHQKNIHIAIMSTHRTKDAVEYLQMANLYHNVHFIIGSDTSSLPLPSTQILETIIQHFGVTPHETLVISSFMALNKAANQVQANVIYCEDLVKAGDYEKKSSYKVAHNLFEILNILLFDRYEELEMYSPILGMDSQMTFEELTRVKQRLEKTYQDDPQILDLVEKTYTYHVSQLGQQNIKDGSILHQKVPARKRFQFEDEIHPPIKEEKPLQKDVSPILKDIKQPQESFHEEINEKEQPQHLSPLDSKEEDELTTLLKQINHKNIQESQVKKVTDISEIQQIVEEAQEESKPEEKQESKVLSLLFNSIYILAISFLIFFIGLIIYIAFIHQFQDNKGIFAIITMVFHGYTQCIETIVHFLFNQLHSLFNFIPNYFDYIQHNAIFSVDGIKLFNLFVFQTIIITIFKTIIHFINKRGIDNESDN